MFPDNREQALCQANWQSEKGEWLHPECLCLQRAETILLASNKRIKILPEKNVRNRDKNVKQS